MEDKKLNNDVTFQVEHFQQKIIKQFNQKNNFDEKIPENAEKEKSDSDKSEEFETHLSKRLKQMEDKSEKHIHLLKSEFLVGNQIDKDLNEMILANNTLNNGSSSKRNQKKNFSYENFDTKHNKSLLDSFESSHESEDEFENDTKRKIEAMHLMRLKNKENSFLRIVEVSKLEKLNLYHDRFPLLKLRKLIFKILILFTQTCEVIVKHPLFEFISFAVIIFNTVILTMDDPTTSEGSLSDKLDTTFLGLYTAELAIKILGLGASFLKDYWNLFDSIIVIFSWMDFLLKEVDYNFAPLRSLRVLRPLKTISSIKKLKMLIMTIFASIPDLLDILWILLFVYLLFAIAGLHIFSGTLKKRCFDPLTGSIHSDMIFCDTSSVCPTNYECGKTFANPNWGVTNFDNLGSSFLIVFQITTMEGWFPIQQNLVNAFSGFVDAIIYLYFVLLLFIGNFFILNLTLAVIIVNFNKTHQTKKENKKILRHKSECECEDSLHFSKMIKCEIEHFQFLKQNKKALKIESKMISSEKPNRGLKVDKNYEFKIKNSTNVKKLRKKKNKEESNEFQKEFNRIPSQKSNAVISNRESKIESFQFLQQAVQSDKRKIQNSLISLTSNKDYIITNPNEKDYFLKDLSFEEDERSETQDIEQEKEEHQISNSDIIDSNIRVNKNNVLVSKTLKDLSKIKANNRNVRRKNSNVLGSHLNLLGRTLSREDLLEMYKNSVRESKEQTSFYGNHEKNTEEIKKELLDIKKKKLIKKFSEDKMSSSSNLQENKLVRVMSQFNDVVRTANKNMLEVDQKNKFNEFSSDLLKDFKKKSSINLPKNRGTKKLAKLEKKLSAQLTKKYGTDEIQDYFEKNNKEGMFKISEEENDSDNLSESNQIFVKEMKQHNRRSFFRSAHRPAIPTRTISMNIYTPKETEVDTEILKDFNNVCFENFSKELKKLKKKKLDNEIKKIQKEEKTNHNSSFLFRSNMSQISDNSQKKNMNMLENKEKEQKKKNQRNEIKISKKKIEKFEKKKAKHLKIAVEICKNHEKIDLFDSRRDIIKENRKMNIFKEGDKRKWKMIFDYDTIQSEFLVKKIKKKKKMKKKHIELLENDQLSIMTKKTINKKTVQNMLKILEEDHKQKGESVLAKSYRRIQKNYLPLGAPKINMETYFFKKYESLYSEEENKENKFLVEKLRRERTKAAKNFKSCMKNEDAMRKFFKDEFKGYSLEREEKNFTALSKKEKRKAERNKLFYESLKENDNKKREVKMLNWPFYEMVNIKNFEMQKFDNILFSLENESLDIWMSGFSGYLKMFRSRLKSFFKKKYIENLFFFFVILNTVVLASEGLFSTKFDEIGNDINNVLTFIFAFEILGKLFAFGFIEFCNDKFNIFDSFVVTLSIVEYYMRKGNNVLTAIRSIRVFKAFRVLRITRLLRSLRFMKIIIEVILSSLEQFTYIALLLMLFILIFTLLGMQLFGGKFDFFEDQEIKRQNFDNVGDAFLTVFQILTIENWNDILYLTMRSSQNPIVSSLYLIICIFIGNYIFLNLFLAILLDGFTSSNTIQSFQEIEKEESRIKTLMKKKIKMLKEKKQELKKKRKTIQCKEFEKYLIDKNSKNKKRKLEKMLLVSENNSEQSENKQESLESNSDFSYSSGKSIDVNAKIFSTHEDLTSTDEDAIISKHLRKEFKTVEKPKEIKICCHYSLFLFSKKNCFRRVISKIVLNPWFERSILILIFLSSLKLMLDTYKLGQDSQTVSNILLYLDNFFSICFLLESLLKIICYGFVLCKNSYLRNVWFCLDFFIVVTSMIDIILKDFDYNYLKILLLLRTLRPLRFVSHYKNLRIVVLSLLESISGLINVLIVILIVWVMFGILGINLLKDKMGYCKSDNIPNYYNISYDTCLEMGGVWDVWGWNFDNILNALVTLFILSSLEGWPTIMFTAIDGNYKEFGPSFKANYYIFVYFILFILIGSLFLMNLFIGFIFFQFTKEQEKEESKTRQFVTEEQKRWVMMQKMIYKAKPSFELVSRPKSKWRLVLYKIFFSKFFESIMMLCIVLNTITMGMIYEGMSDSYSQTIDNINMFFTILFILEAVFKLISVGYKYFYSDWNVFDFAVALISLIDLIIEKVFKLQSFRIYPQIARVIKIMRITRLFKLMKSDKVKSFNKIIRTLIFAFPSLLNVLMLLLLIYFIFSILGVYTFENTIIGKEVFENFGIAFWNLFRFSTGEDWHVSMYNIGINDMSFLSKLYFISFTFISSFVMINMFVLIIIQQFEDFYFDEKNPLNSFEEIATEFRNAWIYYTRQNNGLKISQDKLFEFFANLRAPLGYSTIEFDKRAQKIGEHNFENEEEKCIRFKEVEIQRKIAAMNLRVDKKGFVVFGQVLHAALKNAYGSNLISKRQDNDTYKHIKNLELKTLAKILKKHSNYNDISYQELKNGRIVVRKKANPFMQMLYLNLVFRSWHKYTNKMMNDSEVHCVGNQQDIAIRFENEVLRFIDDKMNMSQSERNEPEEDISKQENSLNNSDILSKEKGTAIQKLSEEFNEKVSKK